MALARRKALSSAGKAAMPSAALGRTRRESAERSTPPTPPATDSAPTIPREQVTARLAKPRTAVPARTAATVSANPGRAAALARRKALSSRGKIAAGTKDRVRDEVRTGPDVAGGAATDSARGDGRCRCGCNGEGDGKEAIRPRTATPSPSKRRPRPRGSRLEETLMNPGRAAALARRRAQSARGKAGVSAAGMSPAQTARAANPELSGRELAKRLREQRSHRGGAGQKRSAPSGRSRAVRTGASPGAAQDAPWKVGASETSHGQTVTGTLVGRSHEVTGDEASTCRTVTGTEYLGTDIFRDFCQVEPPKSVKRGGVSPTRGGNRVTGNEVGRSRKVTGDEPGTCQSVTGTEYMGANLQEAFCGIKPENGPAEFGSAAARGSQRATGREVGRSGRATGDETAAKRTLTGTQYMPIDQPEAVPPKVGHSATSSGGTVTGTLVGRHKAMTGDEAGSCRNVTGDDYIGLEQFIEFCDATPPRTERKIGVSATLGGERITGTMTGRAPRVTGDEPGTCKAITGTPYAGAEQYQAYCESTQAGQAVVRMQPDKRTFGAVMTGIQPAVDGRTTGDAKGACEPVTGTPYVGADQAMAVCPAAPAEPGTPDFPQTLPSIGEASVTEPGPWTDFSIASPTQASRLPQQVTGAAHEGGRITGPFGMASGKVTGTEEARFGRNGRVQVEAEVRAEPPTIDGRIKSRITGEGINAGLKITGDDWDRGERVTGTEGTSALARNPSRRGPTVPMAAAIAKARPENVPEPVSKVTGGSGNTDKGALITYSGGARG
ncbi:Carboxysome shell peptide mid-region [Thioflavicoccus mobilis 8321]|uniref:Carboxysome shell peptide mid-region n=1 Tax=Thioflavicoccus mobilis 8321 TaxID=765912 RepID=L0H087_9GAMM|nr:CsoS2 family carboxysome shell protein [Thioflavicoccus mobilis]AGA91641.1 Carboxysome shell peptide mid-region [Thioflavicoccus mobilis 8321]